MMNQERLTDKQTEHIVSEWMMWQEADPVIHCEVYRKLGCTHVGGPLCDLPRCSIVKMFNKGTTVN